MNRVAYVKKDLSLLLQSLKALPALTFLSMGKVKQSST